jgi:hypothetical protein
MPLLGHDCAREFLRRIREPTSRLNEYTPHLRVDGPDSSRLRAAFFFGSGRLKKFTFVVSGAAKRNKADFGRSGLLHIWICLIDEHELVLMAHNYKALRRLLPCYGCPAGLRVDR